MLDDLYIFVFVLLSSAQNETTIKKTIDQTWKANQDGMKKGMQEPGEKNLRRSTRKYL